MAVTFIFNGALSITGYLALNNTQRIISFGRFEGNGREAIVRYYKFVSRGSPKGTS
jgi:hypothetical protein